MYPFFEYSGASPDKSVYSSSSGAFVFMVVTEK